VGVEAEIRLLVQVRGEGKISCIAEVRAGEVRADMGRWDEDKVRVNLLMAKISETEKTRTKMMISPAEDAIFQQAGLYNILKAIHRVWV
jgi:hypothetical protein